MSKPCGWIGKILRVDLTKERICCEDTENYANRFIGGRGIADKIAWDEISPNINPFDPQNRLIIMSGPTSGTMGSGTGRAQFCTVAPQVYPVPKVTRSSMGGPWAARLKYAGYDGLILQGKAETPVFLWIHDTEAEIKDARGLWGLDTFDAQKTIIGEYGPDVSVITIGPAGENLSRIAIIANETENAAGQGGFGAVMGSKKLKAIALKGSGGVRVADPKRLMETARRIDKLLGQRTSMPGSFSEKYSQKRVACQGCPRSCGRMLLNIPGRVQAVPMSANMTCVETRWVEEGWGIPHRGYKNSYPELPKKTPSIKDVESGFEAKVVGDRYGLNMWEMTIGLVTWLKLCVEAGIITEEDIGMPLELHKGEFWSELFRKIAYREGIGDVLAEGLPRAADILGKGHQYLPHVAHGYAEHWVGRGIQSALEFPFWTISALVWATDSRDPFSDHHRSYSLGSLGSDNPTPYLSDEQARAISKRLYGSEKTSDPTYEYKAMRVIWHQNRCCVDESLVLCEKGGFPMISSSVTRDGFGYPAAESDLFSAVTGVEMSEAELDRIGERIFNLERAIMMREGRSKEYDIKCGVVKYMKERPDRDGIRLDEEKFLKSLDEYYQLRDWDVATGRPRRERMEELGLKDIAQELGRLGLLPQA